MLAAWTGFAAVALAGLCTVAVALLLWIPDADATATSGSVVHAGVVTLLVALHGGARINGVAVGFVPLGLTLAVLTCTARIGRVVWAHPAARDVRTSRILGAQMGAFTVTALVLVPSARLGSTSVSWLHALAGAVAVSGLAFGSAAAGAGRLRLVDLPPLVRARLKLGARAAASALGVYLAGGAVLALAATVAHHARFAALSRSLVGGVSALPVDLIQLFVAPNVVIAAAAYLAGPGFAVGSAHYAPVGSAPGAVPAFPVLAGLPQTDGTADVAVLVLAGLTVLGAGVVAGRVVWRGTRGEGWRAGVQSVAAAAVLGGCGFGALGALAGGRLGAHALRTVGPSPLLVAGAVAGELLVTASATVLSGHLVGALRRRRPGHDDAIGAPVADRAVPVDSDAEPQAVEVSPAAEAVVTVSAAPAPTARVPAPRGATSPVHDDAADDDERPAVAS